MNREDRCPSPKFIAAVRKLRAGVRDRVLERAAILGCDGVPWPEADRLALLWEAGIDLPPETEA